MKANWADARQPQEKTFLYSPLLLPLTKKVQATQKSQRGGGERGWVLKNTLPKQMHSLPPRLG